MAEVAFGVAGGAVGVASLSIQLAESVVKLQRFCRDVKGAPQKLKSLTDGLDTMAAILEYFATKQAAIVDSQVHVQKLVRRCDKAVKDLCSTIEKFEKKLARKRFSGAIVMTLRKEEIDELVYETSMTFQLLDIASNHCMATQTQDKLGALMQLLPSMTSASSPGQILSQDMQGAASDIATATSGSLLKSKRRAGRTGSTEWTLRFRTSWWFSSHAWALSVQRASAGWNVYLRCHKVIPWGEDTEKILQACVYGEMEVLQRLLTTGEFHADDEFVNEYGYINRLPEWASSNGQLPTVCFLAELGADVCRPGRYSPYRILDYYLTHRYRWTRYESLDCLTEEMRRLEDCDLDLQEYEDEPFTGTVAYSVARYIAQPQDKWSCVDRLLLFSFAIDNTLLVESGLEAVKNALHDITYFSVAVDVRSRPYLLHLLAQGLGNCFDLPEDRTRRIKPSLAALIRAGVIFQVDLNILSSLGSGMTPLMHALIGIFSDLWTESSLLASSNAEAVIRDWVTLLHESGVDLEEYGSKEARLWKRWRTSQDVLWRHCFCHLDVLQIRYGRFPSDWGLWVAHPGDAYAGEFWDMVDHPERALPGAWEDDDYMSPEPMERRRTRYLLSI